jgi:hypothetical protein
MSGHERGADLGPMISKAARDRAVALINKGEQQGAKVLLDGRNLSVPNYPNGYWLGPTILSDVSTSMDCYKEEIFGPVLVCLNVDTLDEVRVSSVCGVYLSFGPRLHFASRLFRLKSLLSGSDVFLKRVLHFEYFSRPSTKPPSFHLWSSIRLSTW